MLEPVLPHNLISLHFESSPYVHSSYMHVQACLSVVALRAPVSLSKDRLQATGMCFMHSCTVDHNTLVHMGRTAELQLSYVV